MDEAITTLVAALAVLLVCWLSVSVVLWMSTLRPSVGRHRAGRWHASPGLLRFTMPGTHKLVSSLLMVGVLGLPACSPSPSTDPPTLVWVDEATVSTAAETRPPETTPPSSESVTSGDLIEPVAPPPAPPPSAPSPPSDDAIHVVAEGENLWSIAQTVLTRRLEQPPLTGQIAGYWQVLIEHNRSILVSGDPDLIHIGEMLTLPESGSRSA